MIGSQNYPKIYSDWIALASQEGGRHHIPEFLFQDGVITVFDTRKIRSKGETRQETGRVLILRAFWEECDQCFFLSAVGLSCV